MAKSSLVRAAVFMPERLVAAYDLLASEYDVRRGELLRLALERGYEPLRKELQYRKSLFRRAKRSTAVAVPELGPEVPPQSKYARQPDPVQALADYADVLRESSGPTLSSSDFMSMLRAQAVVLGVPAGDVDDEVQVLYLRHFGEDLD